MQKDTLDLITSAEVQQFIRDHEDDDVRQLLLKKKFVHRVPISMIADQINGRKKAKAKLPILYNTKNIIYPPGLNLEQSSSEITARFKASLLSGTKRFLDLTGGFGIDTIFFSENSNETHYVEPNEELLAIARHNHQQLTTLSNIHYHNTTAENFFQTNKLNFDLIYVDPSRRSKGNLKIFKLSECAPSVPEIQKSLFERSDVVLLKTSPLLDIQQGLKELSFVEKVIVVSVQNDCKELLFLCRNGFSGEPTIQAINILPGKPVDRFQFTFSEERKADVAYSEPLAYILEPNVAILKAGAFKSIAARFNVQKVQINTHLYTAEKKIENFPGRVFKIISSVKPDPKSVRDYLPEGQANVITRHYPLTPDQLKKKVRLMDGGDKYIIGFSGIRSKHLVIAERIK